MRPTEKQSTLKNARSTCKKKVTGERFSKSAKKPLKAACQDKNENLNRPSAAYNTRPAKKTRKAPNASIFQGTVAMKKKSTDVTKPLSV